MTTDDERELAELREGMRKVWEVTSEHTHLDPAVYSESYRRGAAATAWAIADLFGWH